MADLAIQLLEKVKRDEFKKLVVGLPKISSEFGKLSLYHQFCDVLAVISVLRCEKCCREGGGLPNCVIRSCCKERSINGCWMCGNIKDCKKLSWLGQVHTDAPFKNLTKIKEQGIEEFLNGEKYW
jgi:hypothetical protein